MSEIVKEIVSSAGQEGVITMSEWKKRVGAFLKYGNPSQKAIICEGEAGCGKSEITVQACREVLGGAGPVVIPGLGAQQQEELLSAVKLVQDENGDAKLLQGVIDTLIPTERLAKDPKYQVNGRVCIPWIIDEIWTGNMAQMNQVRAALTFRQIGGVQLPNGVFILGTTNPEDVIYSSRRSVDSAVMDRVETFRVIMTFEEHQEFLAREETAGRYPEVCRMFLRNETLSEGIWERASARFWHIQFGQTWMELDMDPDIDDDLKMRLFQTSIADHFQGLAKKYKARGGKDKLPLTADALVARFQNYIRHGDDPLWNPISSSQLLKISKNMDKKTQTEEVKELVRRIDFWKKNEQHGFIGVSVNDLLTGLNIVEDIDEVQVGAICTVLEHAGANLAVDLCSNLAKTKEHISHQILDVLRKGPLRDTIKETIKQHYAVRDNIRDMRRKAAKSKKAKASDF